MIIKNLIALGVLFAATCQATNVYANEVFKKTEATWYGKAWDGRLTASGEVFSSRGFTVAHPTLPLGTVLEVRRPMGKKSIFVRVNDRCRCTMDLAYAAADALGMVRAGRAPIEYVVAKHVPIANTARGNAKKADTTVASADKNDDAPATQQIAAAETNESVDLSVIY